MGGQQHKRGKQDHAHNLVYWLIIHTHIKYVHKHKYSNVQSLHGTHRSPLVSFIQHPQTGPSSYFRMKACEGLALGGRDLEEGEVLLPSPHRHLRRVLSLFNGTLGQRAKSLIPLCCSSNPQLSLIPLTLLPNFLCFVLSACPCLSISVSVPTVPARRMVFGPWSPSGPSALFLGLIGG